MAASFDSEDSMLVDIPPLNEDIYYAVVPLLDRQPDVSAFMRSSRMLYSIGIRALLQMGVWIRTDEHLVSFCEFMQRNLPGCAHHLTQLSICIPRYRIDGDDGSESDLETFKLLNGSSLLVPVVSQLTHIDTLVLEFCEELLECDAYLLDAFSALTTVRTLHVASFGLRTYDLVNTIRSPLTNVHVDGEWPAWDTYLELSLILPDPLEMLSRHQATLEKVSLSYFDATADFVQPSPTTSIFPRVSTLALLDCRVVERAVLVDAFPNIRELEITGEQPYDPRQRFDEDEKYELNRADLTSWWQLEQVYGDPKAVFMLGLHGPIDRLDIMFDTMNGADVERLRTIVDDVLPKRLILHCGVPRPRYRNYTISPSQISNILTEGPSSGNITHIGIDLGLTSISGEPIHYQRAITGMAARLSIQFFTFRIHAAPRECEDEHRAPPSAEHIAILSKFYGKFLAFWAARLAEAVPTLEYLCFRVWKTEVYWRISHERGAPQFSRLSVDMGRAIVQAEGMQWHCGAKPGAELADAESALEAILPDEAPDGLSYY